MVVVVLRESGNMGFSVRPNEGLVGLEPEYMTDLDPDGTGRVWVTIGAYSQAAPVQVLDGEDIALVIAHTYDGNQRRDAVYYIGRVERADDGRWHIPHDSFIVVIKQMLDDDAAETFLGLTPEEILDELER